MYKILIRPLVPEDALISWKWRNDKAVWLHTLNRPNILITQEIEQEWIQRVLADTLSKRFAITVDDIYVGNVQLTDINETDAEFHIFIGEKEYWGKGIAKEAIFQILHYAKEVLKLKNVFLQVKTSNESAIKLYEKCSFVTEREENENVRMNCDLSNLEAPKVSVFCMVYNHEAFIGEALDGILMQKTNFSTVIVLGEDCSTDKTRPAILKYAAQYPGKFKLLLHETNVGAIRNQELVFENCHGEFIAMCEGDDYWSDPNKLQKQVDFLENNPAYGLVCSNYNSSEINEKETADEDLPLDNLLLGNRIGTVTALFRRRFVDQEKPSIFKEKLAMADFQLWVWIATQSKIRKMGNITAFYRILENSASSRDNLSKKMKFEEDALRIVKFFLENTPLSSTNRRKILRERYGHVFEALLLKQDKSFLKYQLNYFKDIKWFNLLDFKILFKGLSIYF